MEEKNSNTSKEEKEKVVELPLELLEPSENHPFKVNDDEKMLELSESIKEYGVLEPSIVRKKENGHYEIVAGHRRKRGSELADKKTMPCIVKDLTDDEAIIIMVDSNIQREEVLPSEKAFAYKLKLEAIKHQGKVKDKTSCQVGTKSRSTEEISETDSARQVSRYIRLTELIPELLEKVDDKSVAFNNAVDISYLTKEEQNHLLDAIECYGGTPSASQAQKMKRLSLANQLNADKIHEIMMEEKGNQKDKYEITYQRFEKYVPRNVVTPKEVETYLLKCAAFCKQNGINVDRVDVSEKQKSNTKNRDAR